MSETNETKWSLQGEFIALQQTLRERDEQLAAVRRERDSDEAIINRLCDVFDCDGNEVVENVTLMAERFDVESAKLAAATARAEAAEREVERLREGLKDLEWGGEHFTEMWCPFCGGDRDIDGHSGDCRLTALLAQPGEEAGDALPKM